VPAPDEARPAACDTSLAPGVAVFLEWLETEASAVLDLMFEAVERATPEVLAQGQPDVDRLRAALISHIPVIRETVASDALELTFTLPAEAERWARHLADVGIDLSALIVAYDAAGTQLLQMFGRWLREVPRPLSDRERADALEGAMERIFRYLRTSSALATAAYSAQAAFLSTRELSRLQGTIEDVLAGHMDEAEAERRLGIRMTAKHVAFVAWTPRVDPQALDRAAAGLSRRMNAWQSVVSPDGPRTVRGWLSVNRIDIERLRRELDLPAGIRVALGSARPGIAGFRQTYSEALEAQRLADLTPTAGALLTFDDIAPLAMTSGRLDMTRSFVERQLGALLDPRNIDLLETLTVWLDELGSPTRAGRRLVLHTNSVVKRLERAERMLQHPLEPGDFALRLATRLVAHSRTS
jgi:DNA-binding PucR family transcriptional regulator